MAIKKFNDINNPEHLLGASKLDGAVSIQRLADYFNVTHHTINALAKEYPEILKNIERNKVNRRIKDTEAKVRKIINEAKQGICPTQEGARKAKIGINTVRKVAKELGIFHEYEQACAMQRKIRATKGANARMGEKKEYNPTVKINRLQALHFALITKPLATALQHVEQFEVPKRVGGML